MTKTRKALPKAISEALLKEYNHKCAVCAKERPQIHHIDEDPSNNEPLNLIPLCPNCHLIDQHNPTVPIDPEKLRLFREHKDPAILKPQFHPMFKRMKFLSSVRYNSDASELEARSNELIEFIAVHEMGAFYSKQVGYLLRRPKAFAFAVSGAISNRAPDLSTKETYPRQLLIAR